MMDTQRSPGHQDADYFLTRKLGGNSESLSIQIIPIRRSWPNLTRYTPLLVEF